MAKWLELRELALSALEPNASSRSKIRAWARLELAAYDASESELKEIRQLQDALDLRKHPQPAVGVFEALFIGIKLLICVVAVLFLAPVQIIVTPIAYLNPLWRKLGLEHNTLPVEMIQLMTFRWACYCLGLEIFTEGEENLPKMPMVFMYTHTSNLDPLAIGAVAPLPMKFIAKRVIFYFPILGWLFSAYGHIPIDRKNRQSAIESLKCAARNVRRSNVSIAISPEGTRSASGHLQEFKKGPFHLSIRSQLPIVPVILFDGYNLMPVGSPIPRPGQLTIRYMEPITDHLDNPSLDVDELSRIVRQTTLRGFAEDDDETRPRKVYRFRESLLSYLPAAFIVIHLILYLLKR